MSGGPAHTRRAVWYPPDVDIEAQHNGSGPSSPPVVVITGASAGIGRAVVRRFAREGADMALLARGEAGLTAAAQEARAGGGRAMQLSVDVADFAAVDEAAAAVEAGLGPIDIWVNCAFTSVFAPFEQIRADEFRRVTEVTYLGAVHGTMAALKRMRPRDRGVVVQVGSALGERSIPLQSAYCGAKHAINGFTEAVRVELMHDRSNVHITLVHAPAVNTPQFSWVRSRLPKRPQPVPPIYEPEIVADTVAFAATHARRKQYWVGASTVATVLAQRLAPAALDRYLARTGYSSQQTDVEEGPREDNLWRPVDRVVGESSRAHGDFGAHGDFDARAHRHSVQAWLARCAESAGAVLRRH
jgi:NAD(P)-dependent dehydrogenase (short-subunit alcohol dehydrogenase family)